MALKSIQTHVSDGTLQSVQFSIAFLNTNHLHFYVDDVEITTSTTSQGVAVDGVDEYGVTLTAAVPSGAVFKVQRQTPRDNVPHVFATGAALFTALTTDANNEYLLYVVQETYEQSGQGPFPEINELIGTEYVTVEVGGTRKQITVQNFLASVASTASLILDLANKTDPAKGVALVGGAARVVDSIADLRLLPSTGSQTAIVLGYYTKGDSGGGDYYFDASDTISVDNGGSVIVATDGGRWKLRHSGEISAAQFGVIFDGATDNTIAIQAAIDSLGSNDYYESGAKGGIVNLPKGIGLITNIVLKNGVTLRGQGKGRTYLQATHSASGWMIQSTAFSDGTRSYQTNIEELSLYCKAGDIDIISQTVAPSTTVSGIYLPTTIGLMCKNVAVWRGKTNWKFDTSQDSQFYGCEGLMGTENLVIGYYGSDTSNALRFTDCRFAAAYPAASAYNLKIDGTSSSQVRDITFCGCTFEAGLMSLTRCDGVRFIGGSITSQVAGAFMLTVFDSAGQDTRDIEIIGTILNSGSPKTAKMVNATNTTNPVLVTGCTITTLAANAFTGNVNVVNNTGYDLVCPVAHLLGDCDFSKNSFGALDTSSSKAVVSWSTSQSAITLYNLSSGVFNTETAIVPGVDYVNTNGFPIQITYKIKPLGSDNVAITCQFVRGKVFDSKSGSTFNVNGNTAAGYHLFTVIVQPGEAFIFVSTNTTQVTLDGAFLSKC